MFADLVQQPNYDFVMYEKFGLDLLRAEAAQQRAPRRKMRV
jgi:hypothetical protein